MKLISELLIRKKAFSHAYAVWMIVISETKRKSQLYHAREPEDF